MPLSYSFANAQCLLIKPFNRLGFIFLYILASGVSIFAANFLTQQDTYVQLLLSNPKQYTIIAGLISGTFMGAAQWLILRRYFPDWKWILALAFGSTFSSTLNYIINARWNQTLFKSVGDLSGPSIGIVETIAMYMALLGASVLAYFLQWYILQAYVAPARWWIMLPFITAPVVMLPFLIKTLAQTNIPFPISIQSNINLLFPASQAIAFCCLHKKSKPKILQSALASTKDVTSYRMNQVLRKKLYASLTQLWRTGLSSSIEQLSYLVGVHSHKSKIIFEPMNSTSADNVDLTPLSKIASPLKEAEDQLENETFAKFQVIFSPPGAIQIHAWRGIPLVWMGVGVYIAVIAIQSFWTWFQFG